MAHLVTSSQGVDHIESYNARHLNAGTQGNGSYALTGRGNFALSMPNTNTLRIAGGDALCCGAQWSIDESYEEVTIENGSVGTKRIDLVVADITTAPKEECKLLVLKGEETTGEPVAPTPLEGDLNAGDTHVQMPVAEVPIDGINPGTPVLKMDFLMPAAEFQAQQKEAWDSIFQVVQGEVTKTIPAAGVVDFVFSSLRAPDGYRKAAIEHINDSTAGACVPSDIIAGWSSGTTVVVMRNTTSTEQPCRLSVGILCVRDGR